MTGGQEEGGRIERTQQSGEIFIPIMNWDESEREGPSSTCHVRIRGQRSTAKSEGREAFCASSKVKAIRRTYHTHIS